jgi:hypothetical protein
VQRSPTDCDASLCVIRNLVNEEAIARAGLQRQIIIIIIIIRINENSAIRNNYTKLQDVSCS